MQTKTVMLIGALGLAAGWLVGSSTVSQSPGPATGTSESRRGPRPLGAGSNEPLAPYTDQLRLKLQEQPRSPSPGRNPFVFGSRRSAPPVSSRAPGMESPIVDAPPPPPAVPLGPRFALSGVASSQKDGVTTWTAIVVDNGELVFVTPGDRLSSGYTVTKVDETSATVVDGAGGQIVLRLKQ